MYERSRCVGSKRAACRLALSILIGLSFAPASADDDFTDIALAHDAGVGTLAGEAGTEGGAATYHVPIVVPPGRAGVEPSLSLDYSSRSGDGVAGLGWTLGGVSSIHRCPQTPEQDDPASAAYVPAVTYTNNDRLCLDGQRLVKVNGGAYGAAGSEYRTEVDGYARIVQTGGDLAGANTCFRVERRNGRVLHYGAVTNGSPMPTGCAASSAHARVQPTGAAATLAWQVERIEDRAGNDVLYAYTDFGNGEVLLHTVTYTGYAPTSTVGDRTVTLAWMPRTSAAGSVTDVASSWLAGGLSMQTQALASITTAIAGVTVRTITPSYAVAGHAGETNGYAGRLFLTSLTECATNATGTACHPPTRFLYNDGPLVFALQSMAALQLPPSIDDVNPIRVDTAGDLDGDGTREMEVSIVNRATGYLAQATADRTLHPSLDLSGLPPACFGAECAADFDGSGRSIGTLPPLSAGAPQVLSLAAWNYAKFARGAVATSNPFFTATTPIVYAFGSPFGSHSAKVADFDGDGRPDIALIGPAASCGSDAFGTKPGLFLWRNALTSPLSAGQTASFVPTHGSVGRRCRSSALRARSPTARTGSSPTSITSPTSTATACPTCSLFLAATAPAPAISPASRRSQRAAVRSRRP